MGEILLVKPEKELEEEPPNEARTAARTVFTAQN